MSANSSSILRFYSSSLPASNSLKNVIKTIGDTKANQGLSFFIENPLGVTIATSSFINSASYSGSENFKIPAYPGTYGEQPSRWVQKTYIIKKAINKITQKAQEDGK